MAHTVEFAAVEQVHLKESELDLSNASSGAGEIPRWTSAPIIVRETVECRICGSTDGAVPASICQHTFCEECLRDYLAFKVTDGITQISCPSFQCREYFSDEMLERFLSPEAHTKLLRFRKWSELEASADFRWCPKVDCEGFDYGGVSKKKLKCRTCGFEYCFMCQEAWHTTTKCRSEPDQKFSKWVRSHHAKFCPKCRSRIEKNRGCNHMTCAKCRYEFCWLCGDVYTYDHFRRCSVLRVRRRNPPWMVCLALLTIPLWAAFVFVILMGIFMRNFERSDPNAKFSRFLRLWYLSYPMLLALALLATPLAMSLCLLCGLSFLLVQLGHRLRYYNHCACLRHLARWRCWWNSLSIVVGVVLCPVTVAAAALALVLGPVCGLLLLLHKALVIPLVRCCRRDFMKPQGSVDGFPMG